MNIQLGTSPNFYNKTNRAPVTKLCRMHTEFERRLDSSAPEVYDHCWAFSQFRTAQLAPEKFIEHVLSGSAWIPSVFKNGRRTNENWQQAELISVDYDNNVSMIDCLKVEFIQRYALLVHPSASSGKPGEDGQPIYKTRVIFRLDHPITGDFENYRMASRAVCRHLGLDADPASFKPAQLYYGSDNQVEAAYERPDHLLPIMILDDLITPLKAEIEQQRLELERRRTEQHYQPVAKDSDRASQSIQRVLDYAYRKVAGTMQDRTGAAHDQAWWLARFLMYWPVTEMEIERAMLDAARANGSVDKYGEHEMQRHIHNGIQAGKATDAEPLELPAQRAQPSAKTTPEPEPPRATTQERHGEPEIVPPLVAWRSSDDGMAAYRESLKTARSDGTIPLLFPFKALSHFDGFAHILDSGVLVGIVGMSGGLKTSFLETITDAWRRMDANDILWWGTEWSWDKMAGRAIQRYGGATLTAKSLHDLWLIERQHGIPPEQRHGVELPAYVQKESASIAEIITSWPGKSHQLDDPVSDVDLLLKLSAERITELSAQGRCIRVCVWDYVQLLDLYAAKNENEKVTSVLGKLKLFCIEHKLVGVVASQVTKAGSSSAKSGDEVLQSESGQYFRSDKFNLVLTLNPVYEGKLLTTRGVINVAKNSTGRTGIQTVFIDPSKFKWIDTKVPDNQQVRNDELPELEF